MHLYLITHAHTVQNSQADARSWRLSSHGTEQGELLSHLPIWDSVHRIALSSEPKTFLTVEPVIERDALPVVTDARFDELQRGGWVGDYGARVRTAFARPDESIGGWEPATQALERFLDGVNDLGRHFPGEPVALVSHGLVLSLYRAYLLGRSRVRYADWQALGFGAVALADPVAGNLLRDFKAVSDGPLRSTQ